MTASTVLSADAFLGHLGRCQTVQVKNLGAYTGCVSIGPISGDTIWRILDVPVVVVVLRLYVCIGLRQGSVFPVCFQLGPDGSMPARARWQHARARLLGRWIVGCCRCWCHSWTQPVDQGPFTFTIASSPRWPWPCGGQFAQFTIASSPCESRSSSLLQRNGHSSLLLRHSPLVERPSWNRVRTDW